jgi:DNA-binding XRE family transcriptional regulator
MESKNHMAVLQLQLLGFPRANIRKALHKLTGVTQPAMSQVTGINRQTVTAIISGARVNRDHQKKIAALWHVPVDVLFDVAPEPSGTGSVNDG